MKNKISHLLLVLSITLVIGLQDTTAQNKHDRDCAVGIPNQQVQRKVKSHLSTQSTMIKFILHAPNTLNDNAQYAAWAETHPTELNNTPTQTVDSIIINLNNELSWNLDSMPPKVPRSLISVMIKSITKDTTLNNAMLYMKFCTRWDETNKHPCPITYTFSVYTKIQYGLKEYFKAVYAIDEHLKITDRTLQIIE